MNISIDSGCKSKFHHTLLFSKQTCVKHGPCGKREKHAYRSSRGIQHIGKCLSRKLPLIVSTLHANADGKNIQIIVHKNKNSHEKRCKKRFPLCVTHFRNHL